MYYARHVRRGAVAAAAIVSAACSSGTSPQNRACYVTDPAGDFIPSFAGPNNPDLDARTMHVTYDGTTFDFAATVNGTIGQTAGAVYVWGINRGAGTARFGSIATGVLFDAVLIVKPDGTGSVRDFITSVSTALPASAVTINGTSIDVHVAASLLPTQGFAPGAYTTNFWPRTGLASNSQIADFAPDNSMAPVCLR